MILQKKDCVFLTVILYMHYMVLVLCAMQTYPMWSIPVFLVAGGAYVLYIRSKKAELKAGKCFCPSLTVCTEKSDTALS